MTVTPEQLSIAKNRLLQLLDSNDNKTIEQDLQNTAYLYVAKTFRSFGSVGLKKLEEICESLLVLIEKEEAKNQNKIDIIKLAQDLYDQINQTKTTIENTYKVIEETIASTKSQIESIQPSIEALTTFAKTSTTQEKIIVSFDIYDTVLEDLPKIQAIKDPQEGAETLLAIITAGLTFEQLSLIPDLTQRVGELIQYAGELKFQQGFYLNLDYVQFKELLLGILEGIVFGVYDTATNDIPTPAFNLLDVLPAFGD